MVFIELNDNRKVNLIHISEINIEDKTIMYKTAKGSLSNIVEYFETAEEAQSRYSELQNLLLV